MPDTTALRRQRSTGATDLEVNLGFYEISSEKGTGMREINCAKDWIYIQKENVINFMKIISLSRIKYFS